MSLRINLQKWNHKQAHKRSRHGKPKRSGIRLKRVANVVPYLCRILRDAPKDGRADAETNRHGELGDGLEDGACNGLLRFRQ